MSSRTLVSLDVGEKRIGVAVADIGVRIAVPFTTIEVDGTELEKIADVVAKEGAETLVVGYPRNQSGEPTAQTDYVEKFTEQLQYLEVKIVFQDESLTSVMAEQRLGERRQPFTKAEIDAEAAAIILQDYLEVTYG